MLPAVAYQVGTPHRLEGLAQQGPVVRVVVAQKCLVQAPTLFAAHDVHRFALARDAAQRIPVAVVHRRRGGHRAGVKRLHLVGTKAIFFQPLRQVHHVFVAGARMGGDEIRDQELLLAGLGREPVKHLLELVVAADARFHHLVERAAFGMLRRDLQVTAYVVLHQFLHILGALQREVITQSGADQYLLDALEAACPAVHVDQRGVVGVEVGADAGVDTTRLAAGGLDLRALAADAVHVGGGAAQIADDAGEALDLVADVFHLADHAVLAAALDDAAFVLGDGAERAATKTATHDVHGEADHLPRWYLGRAIMAAQRVGIRRVRAARIRQVEHEIHLGRGERYWRRVDPHITRCVAFSMGLHQCTRVAGVGLQVQDPVGVGIQHGIGLDLLVTRQANHATVARWHLQFAL